MLQDKLYSRLVQRANRMGLRAQYELDTHYHVKAKIDEVSILFSTPETLDQFMYWADTHPGLTHFNSVKKDFAEQLFPDGFGPDDCEKPAYQKPGFDVRFEFFQMTGQPWRIEAMCVLDGRALLHEKMVGHDLPHVSFKCADFEHYIHTCRLLEGMRFDKKAEYRNTYGQFSYYGDGPAGYLKPRVNLRDR